MVTNPKYLVFPQYCEVDDIPVKIDVDPTDGMVCAVNDLGNPWDLKKAMIYGHEIDEAQFNALAAVRAKHFAETSKVLKYSPDQPRAADGRFGSSAGAMASNALGHDYGFTVDPVSGKSPTTGYQCAVVGHTEKFDPAIISDPAKLRAAFADFKQRNYSVLQSVGPAGGHMFIGGWVQDGSLWMEPSENIQNKATAVQEGAAGARNQISVWDNAKEEEIVTGGNGDNGVAVDHINGG